LLKTFQIHPLIPLICGNLPNTPTNPINLWKPSQYSVFQLIRLKNLETFPLFSAQPLSFTKLCCFICKCTRIYMQYIWISKSSKILQFVLRSPNTRSCDPSTILPRITTLTTLLSTTLIIQNTISRPKPTK